MDNLAPGITHQMLEKSSGCDACTDELSEDCLLNDNGQFCNEHCEADFLAAPKTLTDVAKRDFGLRENGERI